MHFRIKFRIPFLKYFHSLYEKFKNLGYNTVLQNNATMTDDGSLSVLAGQQNIPYVNVEAQHGHLEEQVEMLFVLMEVLDEQ